MATLSGIWRERYGGLSITPGFVKHTFRAMSRVGMVESTQGIILLGKMWRHVTFGNVYCKIDCVHT
jgi:DNA-binding IscR family transcriptional regulator